jgi:prepilin-type N-terminal cleavage/methylation domain-containing protein
MHSRTERAIRLFPRGRKAFTLVELLIVIGIIVVLLSILMPAFSAARSQSVAVRCMNNLRQLGFGLLQYAADNRGNFPENVTTPEPEYWYTLVSSYLPPVPVGASTASIYVCPADDTASLSYAMNLWASSAVNKSFLKPLPPDCQLWPHVVTSSELLLLSESWSYEGSAADGYQANPWIGVPGTTPGQRFGGSGGIAPYSAGRWGDVNCELAYNRHRHGTNFGTQPIGLVNILFDDGHVALCSNGDLVDPVSGVSTGLAGWNMLDYMK